MAEAKQTSPKPETQKEQATEQKVVPLKPKAAEPKVEPKAKSTVKKPATKAAKKATPKAAKNKPAVKKKASAKAPKKAAKKSVNKTPTKAAKPKTNKPKAKTVKKPALKVTKVSSNTNAGLNDFIAQSAELLRVPTPQFAPKTLPQDMETIMTQSKNQFDQFTKEATAASRESMDAFTKSGTIFAKGFEEIIRETMNFAQSAAEKQMQFAKEAMSVKTINEWSDVQNKIAQTSFDDAMASATKITELTTKVLTDAIEPINSQVTKTVQKATDAVAAE